MSRQSRHGWAGYTLLRWQGGGYRKYPNIIDHAKENEPGRTNRPAVLGEYLLIHVTRSPGSTSSDCLERIRRAAACGFSAVVAIGVLSLLSACATPPRSDAGIGETPRAEGDENIGAVAKSEAPKARSPSSGASNSASKQREPRLTPDKVVYFSSSSFDLSAEGLQTVRSFADRLNGNRRLVVTLIGSTDGLGSKEMCVAIANKRNAAVEGKLLGLGVKRQQIRKYARGCEAGADLSCTSDSCRKQYRRVELQIENS